MAGEPVLEEELELTPEQRIARLWKRDIRLIGLVALGWPNRKIALRMGMSVDVVKTYLYRIKRVLGVSGRSGIALFYVRYILPTDMEGRPPSGMAAYTEPGQKLVEWTARAEAIRAELRKAGILEVPGRVETAMLLTDFATADLVDAALAEHIDPSAFIEHVAALCGDMTNPGRLKLGVIATLAPFDVDEPERESL